MIGTGMIKFPSGLAACTVKSRSRSTKCRRSGQILTEPRSCNGRSYPTRSDLCEGSLKKRPAGRKNWPRSRVPGATRHHFAHFVDCLPLRSSRHSASRRKAGNAANRGSCTGPHVRITQRRNFVSGAGRPSSGRITLRQHDSANSPGVHGSYAILVHHGIFLHTAAAQKLAEWLTSAELDQYLIQRIVSVLTSFLTCIFVFRIGSLLMDRRSGMIAMILMGFSFLPIELAHIGIVEPTMVFFFTLAFAMLLEAYKAPSVRSFAIAGFLAGAAIAVKQTAALIGLPLIVAWILLWKEKRVSASGIKAVFTGAWLPSPDSLCYHRLRSSTSVVMLS
jgi:hypothetical protein